jgi:hypothetical protein
LLVALSSGALSCGDPPDGSDASPSTADSGEEAAAESAEAPLTPGEEAILHLSNDSTQRAFTVGIRRPDGTVELAVFRGPTKLADVITDGTFIFSEDSLPSRVRRLRPGEELRRANR